VTLKCLRPKPLSLVALGLIICAALFVNSRTRSTRAAFGLAEDFPRGALVYAQFKDLPALIKQWDQSRLKQQYLESANYKEFLTQAPRSRFTTLGGWIWSSLRR